jgi:hypothetical protein
MLPQQPNRLLPVEEGSERSGARLLRSKHGGDEAMGERKVFAAAHTESNLTNSLQIMSANGAGHPCPEREVLWLPRLV